MAWHGRGGRTFPPGHGGRAGDWLFITRVQIVCPHKNGEAGRCWEMQKMRLHLMMDPCSRGPEPCDGGDASRSLSSHLSREQEQWRHRGIESRNWVRGFSSKVWLQADVTSKARNEPSEQFHYAKWAPKDSIQMWNLKADAKIIMDGQL